MNERVDIVHEIFSNGAPVVFFLAILICLTWTINTLIKSLRQRANVRTRADLYRQMIDRFGSAPEFIAFLQSDTGRGFIDENISEAGPPAGKILGSMQIGVVTTVVGIGLVFLGNESWLGGDINLIFYIVGTVSLTIGIGFIVSTFIAYKLSTKWGLLDIKRK